MIKITLLIFLLFFTGCLSSSWVDTPVVSQDGEGALVSDAKSVLPMKSILIFPVQIPASSQEIGMKFQTKIHAELVERFREVPGLKIETLKSIPESTSLRFEDPSFWQKQGRKYQADGILVIVNQGLYKPSAADKAVEYLILSGQGIPQAAWRVVLFSPKTRENGRDRPLVEGVTPLTGIGIIASSIEDTLAPIAKAIAKSWPLDPDQWALGKEGWIGSYFEQDHYLKRGIQAAGVSEEQMTLDSAKHFKNHFPLKIKNLKYTIKFDKLEHHEFLIQWFSPSGEKMREHKMKMTGWDMGIEMDIFHLNEIPAEKKEGFWTIKLWEGETLVDHRRFLIGSAAHSLQPALTHTKIADQGQIRKESSQSAQRREPKAETSPIANQRIPRSRVEAALPFTPVSTQDEDVLVRAKAALERARRMSATVR